MAWWVHPVDPQSIILTHYNVTSTMPKELYSYVTQCDQGPLLCSIANIEFDMDRYLHLNKRMGCNNSSPIIHLQLHFSWCFNAFRPRQNGRHVADIFKCKFLNKSVWIPIKISLIYFPKGPIINVPALVKIIACRLPGDKPLSELMVIS